IAWSMPGPPCSTNRGNPAPRSSTYRLVSPMSTSEPAIPATYTRRVAETPQQWLPPVASEPAPPAANEPAHDAFGEHNRKRGGGILAALAVLAAKGKALLLLLPKLKLLTTSGSMLVSIGAYTLIWGWQFAIGFVLL